MSFVTRAACKHALRCFVKNLNVRACANFVFRVAAPLICLSLSLCVYVTRSRVARTCFAIIKVHLKGGKKAIIELHVVIDRLTSNATFAIMFLRTYIYKIDDTVGTDRKIRIQNSRGMLYILEQQCSININ